VIKLYDQSFTVKIIVLLIVGASIGWFLFNRLGDVKYKRLKQYGPIFTSVFNILFWWWLFAVDDFYFLEFYLIGGAGVIAALCVIWNFKEKEAKLKKISYILNGLFIVAYTALWCYAYALGKAWSI